MKKRGIHIKQKEMNMDLSPYSNLNPDYKQNKEEVWNRLSEMIDQKEVRGFTPFWGPAALKYSLAAMVVIMLGVTLFMRFHTKTISTSYGESAELVLPDESKVFLNAVSELTYSPYWWRVKRTVILNGEAYFEVEKGERFSVISDLGKTSVLGTTFNVYARENMYDVTCLSGSVKVEAMHENLVLKPSEKAVLDPNKGLAKKEVANFKSEIGWMTNEFFYTAQKLSRVISDIELQYHILINVEPSLNIGELVYTGNFEKSLSPENVLYFVFKPYGFEAIKLKDGEYVVKHAN